MVVGIEVHVDGLGRIVISKKYRKLYNINELDDVYVVGTEDGLLICKNNYKMVEVEDKNM